MCGIVGVRKSWLARLGAGGDPLDEALRRMHWRGADARGTLEIGGWCLGVARLAISRPGADQPIRLDPDGPAVAFNGAVTSAAGERRRRTESGNDAELLLCRFRTEGPAALRAMSGPHAFAVVDPEQDRLWLGRDEAGEKPLYVVRDGRGRVLAFASTTPALAALGFASRFDERERARLLQFGFCGDPSSGEVEWTLHSLAPGLWDASDGLQSVSNSVAPDEAPGQRLVAALEGAVARCAAATVPVGLSLSGGIDSACIAAAGRGRGWPAYQFCARGAPAEERARAAAVALHTGHTLRPVDGGPAILQELPALTAAHGQPLGDPSVLAAHAVAQRAAAEGVRVLLSGEGADEVLVGYRRQRAIAALPARGIRWLPRWGAASRREPARLWRALTAAEPYAELLRITPPGLAARMFRGEAATAATLPDLEVIAAQRGLDRAVEIDRAVYLRRDLLPKLDVATLAAGVEGRCPFLDRAVLYCDVVTSRSTRQNLGKRALRAAFEHRLPLGFMRQRKVGFAIPLDRWLREDDFLVDVLRDRRTLEREHIDAAGLREAVDTHRAGRAELGHPLYLVAALELHDRSVPTPSGDRCASSVC